MTVPASRIRLLNSRAVASDGDYVLYWMTATRRTRSNFGLERAAEVASDLDRPLLVLEALRSDYPWASDRLHKFVLDGMADNAAAFAAAGVRYHPYVEPAPAAGRGLIRALAARACVVVTDWYPAFFYPRMIAAAAAQVPVAMEAVDALGIIPVSEHGRAFPTARGYRAFMQRTLREHLRGLPLDDPLHSVPKHIARLPAAIGSRWPAASAALLRGSPQALAALPIDHTVAPVETRGGSAAAALTLRAFIQDRLAHYGDRHNHPDDDGTSRLSPYLHFGHIAAQDVFSAVMTRERWTTRKLGPRAPGAREGWWGVTPSAEAFLDQLVVWRELALNGCEWTSGYERYETLPAWARATLEAHADDERPHRYSLEQLETASTADDVWNAVQRQLVSEGWFHGYLRMLWGKKIVEWTDDPAEALARMTHLMNRYSLDGRDPVSYASFGWVLGRYDRPWPERPVFGTVRYMTSGSAKRKLKMKKYLQRYGARDLLS